MKRQTIVTEAVRRWLASLPAWPTSVYANDVDTGLWEIAAGYRLMRTDARRITEAMIEFGYKAVRGTPRRFLLVHGVRFRSEPEPEWEPKLIPLEKKRGEEWLKLCAYNLHAIITNDEKARRLLTENKHDTEFAVMIRLQGRWRLFPTIGAVRKAVDHVRTTHTMHDPRPT